MYKYRIIVSVVKIIFRWPSNTGEKYSMLKNFGKKILMGLMCSSILICASVPAFASTKEVTSVKALSTASTSANGNTQLVDETPVSIGIWNGIAAFNVNVHDSNKRYFEVTSSVPVRVIITSSNGNTSYNSGDYRLNPTVALHFCPFLDNTVLIQTQNDVNANVRVGMSKQGTNSSVINMATTSTVTETNTLAGQENEMYNVSFSKTGTYRVTVSNEISNTRISGMIITGLTATVMTPNGGQVLTNLPIYSTNHMDFVVSTPTTTVNSYGVMLYNNNSTGSGGKYTINIKKIS